MCALLVPFRPAAPPVVQAGATLILAAVAAACLWLKRMQCAVQKMHNRTRLFQWAACRPFSRFDGHYDTPSDVGIYVN